MSKNIRFDSIKMPKMIKTKEGYLRGEAVVSRIGVFNYKNFDGTIRGELRHPDEIFKKKSMDSLKMIPITNDHPPEFVDAKNAHKYQVGYTGEHYDVMDDKIIVSMTVTHQDAIDAILAGKLELSMGYDTELVKEEGVYGDSRYDFKQIDPKYNHLAIVEKGRAGREARVRFDKAAELVELPISEPRLIQKTDKHIDKHTDKQIERQMDNGKENNSKIDNIKDDQTISRLDAVREDNKALEEKIIKLQERLDAANTSQEVAKNTLEQIRSEKTDTAIETKASEKLELLLKAAPFLDDVWKNVKKTDREIMESVLQTARRTDSTDLKDHSDDYLRGMFDAFVASATGSKLDRNHNDIFEVIKRPGNNDSLDLSPHKAREESLRETWMKQNIRGN